MTAAVSLRRPAARLALAVAAILGLLAPAVAFAKCSKNLADGTSPRIVRASFGEGRLAQTAIASEARITFVGHASFQIETPTGVRVITDYNGVNGYGRRPDIVTMNNAHTTHYSDEIEPGVTHALRGWPDADHDAVHAIEWRDIKVWNVPTNARDYGGVRRNGNSIFAFQIGDLCIAHLGHLHHRLNPDHLEALGRIDVLMVPIDGNYTMRQGLMADVVRQIQPRIVLPMHYWGRHQFDRFTELLVDDHDLVWPDTRTIDVSKKTLPEKPRIVALAGSGGD